MKFRFALAIAALVPVLLSGCVAPPQKHLALKTDTLNAQAGRVGVAMTPLPKVNTFFPGASCLLCIGAAEIANSSLSSHTKTLTHEDLPTLKDQAAEILRKKGLEVIVINEALDVEALNSASGKGDNLAKKDFAPLAQKYGIDRLMVFSIETVGFTRSYSAYIPNEDPKATLNGTAYMVNLKTNTYEWYAPIANRRAATGAWDESPSFPGLTNAYYQVLEVSKDKFLHPLTASAETP